ncbi:MAG: alpha/beta fold hydrolase [Planctomycetota bacterium]|jgi:esterase/lipase/1-acyl-sn-glycerol-3-phosphate acyltransferase
MNLRTYKATGLCITAARRLLGLRIRVSGGDALPDRPTVFAANHFTRLETLLVPYVIYQCEDRPVRSLATHTVFRGAIGRYLRNVGVMSVRDPQRNRTIMSDLITRRSDWVIYPEGGLIKNKKVVDGTRLSLSHPRRVGPPHTGGAMLALKAEIAKRRFVRACRAGDEQRLGYYRHALGLRRVDDVHDEPIVIVPLTIGFYPLRPQSNLLARLVRRLSRPLDPRAEEELLVESSLLVGRGEVFVHFGQPIEVADYLDAPTTLARRIVGLFSESRHADVLLRRQAARLTEDTMRRVYAGTEVNVDHLFCTALRTLQQDRVPIEELHRGLHLAGLELRRDGGVRLHPGLLPGLGELVRGADWPALEDVRALAERQGVLCRDGTDYLVDRAALRDEADFHRIRLEATVQVIANEIEPNAAAVQLIERSVNLPAGDARRRLGELIHERHVTEFRLDYETWFEPEESKPVTHGQPLLLMPRRPRGGVVLVHGYLSSPEQMRPLAERLRERGLVVYAVRLPGHGTAPEQLTQVTWRQWLDAVLHAHDVVAPHAGRTIVGGFSLGGILALLLAARRRDDVHGVFTINAPIRLRDFRAPLVPVVVQASGTLRRFGLSSAHPQRTGHRTESPETNYARDYLHGVRELRRAISAARCDLGNVTAPALVLQSDADPVVAPASGPLLLDALGSASKRLVELASARHVVLQGPEREAVFAAIAHFVDEQVAGSATETNGSAAAG